MLSLFISLCELIAKEWSHASVLGVLKPKSSGGVVVVDALPVVLACGVEVRLSMVDGV